MSIPPVSRESSIAENPIGTNSYAKFRSSATRFHSQILIPVRFLSSSTINGGADV
jgi:hypothetical protein